jgi:hypothetical protein
MAKDPVPVGVVECIEAFCANTLSGVPVTISRGQRLRADDELALRFERFFASDAATSAEIAEKRHALYVSVYDAA